MSFVVFFIFVNLSESRFFLCLEFVKVVKVIVACVCLTAILMRSLDAYLYKLQNVVSQVECLAYHI
jgi:hypothetical protein